MSAANANAAQAAATSATAALQTLDLSFSCQAAATHHFTRILVGAKTKFCVSKFHLPEYLTSRAMKATADAWVALEDEEDEDEGDGEEVMQALFEEEEGEGEETDEDSDSEAAYEIYELY